MCFRRSSLTHIPLEGISLNYLKTQEPKWEKLVTVPVEELKEFFDRYDMPNNETFLYFVEDLKTVKQRASKNAPDWKE